MRGLFGKLKRRCENRELCSRFPFLRPWNRFTGEYVHPYDYSYTELDDMPSGWRKRFGMKMCEEIRTALIGDGDLDRWKIVQMKEKYGELRIYDNGHKKGSPIDSIINKYALISRYTCVLCGADATRVTTGWISPYCDKCCPNVRYKTIKEAYEGEEEFV